MGVGVVVEQDPKISSLPLLPFNLPVLKDGIHTLRSSDVVQFVVPKVQTVREKRAFSFSAPITWNNLVTD